MNRKLPTKTIEQLRKEIEDIERRGSFTVTVRGEMLEALLDRFKRMLDDEEKRGITELSDTLQSHAILNLHLGTIKSDEIEGAQFEGN